MSEYRVLARKYRPTSFESLIGQEVLVQTLSNAIARNRLAHAFLLTGIRGIGKTTTARIIAKALNCIGPDGNGGPTISPCGVCPNCVAIAEDRHVDVLEMDAASRTGVDDIRDLIETVHYAPTNARYKVYIIDEVHMLSKSAFNALLKTLEEPPPHVKFVFATTELRKIPVTILSRCQRFDLKRIDVPMLAAHLQDICGKESVTADAGSLELIAAAAEGSVRDSLSLLDQAIAHAEGEEGAITIHADKVAAMLGLSDKHRNFVLLEALFEGKLPEAIAALRDQYAAGADPVMVLEELLELVHGLTQRKAGVAGAQNARNAVDDNQLAETLASSLSLTVLTRAWQMLLKGLQETQLAPNPLMAAEMVLIRIAHMAEMPAPADLIRQMKGQGNAPQGRSSAAGNPGMGIPHAPVMAAEPALFNSPAPTMDYAPQTVPTASYDRPVIAGGYAAAGGRNASPAMMVSPALQEQPAPVLSPAVVLQDFDQVLALFYDKREMILHMHLDRDAQLVSFQQGRIEVNFGANVPNDVPGKIGQCLSEWTQERWIIVLSQQSGAEPRYVTRQQKSAREMEQAAQHPLVAEVLQLFPGAKIERIESGQKSGEIIP